MPVVSLIVRDTPEQCGLAVDGGAVSDAPEGDKIVTGISSVQAIRLSRFWIITGILTLGTGTIYSLALHLVSIVRIIEPETGMSILAASIIGVMMIIGRLLARLCLRQDLRPLGHCRHFSQRRRRHTIAGNRYARHMDYHSQYIDRPGFRRGIRRPGNPGRSLLRTPGLRQDFTAIFFVLP